MFFNLQAFEETCNDERHDAATSKLFSKSSLENGGGDCLSFIERRVSADTSPSTISDPVVSSSSSNNVSNNDNNNATSEIKQLFYT